MSTVMPRSDYAREILHVYGIITWVTLGIAAFVGLALAWVLTRFRARPGTTAMPAQIRGHTLLEMAWTVGPALVLLGIAIPTIQAVFRTQAAPPKDALEVTVRGHQWWWEFQYPVLQVATANELHVPAGRTVALTLEGPDVIHSFSRVAYLLPHLRGPVPIVMSYQRDPTLRTVGLAVRLAAPGFLHFTGCSEYIARCGRRAGGEWLGIPNFADTEQLSFSPSVAADAPLVFLSRVETIKGADWAIEIARRSGRRLLIAGNHSASPHEAAYWKEKIEPWIGRDGIDYVGPVDDVQKNELLGKAAAMVVPIQWDEPFGIVFAESLACGTPVIACPRGALPEIVRPGIDGFLINAIEEGVVAVGKIGALDRAVCRQRAEQYFSAQAVVARYIELYERLRSARTAAA